jgi:hypothetical protein
MSSSDASHNESPPDGRGPAEPESPEEETATPSEGSPEPIECPNCGHEFTGNYCPECGQEANPSVSLTEVIGGFFRQFGDLEHGFWPTFVGLTVRPGEVLQGYLGGVRKGLMSPGRYLLAALVDDVGADRLLVWIGARTPLWTDAGMSRYLDLEASLGAGSDDIFYTAFVEVFTVMVDPQTRFILLLLMAGLLAPVLYRLFAELGRISEALAVGSFLVAHVTFLSTGADLLYVAPVFLYTRRPVDPPSFLMVISLGYLAFASYKAFGPGWKGALKGGIAGGWAFVLTVSVFGLSACAYAVGLAMWYPWGWEYLSTGGVLASSIIFAIPLLLHAAVELYLRYRG